MLLRLGLSGYSPQHWILASPVAHRILSSVCVLRGLLVLYSCHLPPGYPFGLSVPDTRSVPGLYPVYTIRSIPRSEEHTSELQSRENLVCRLLLEKKKRSPSGQPQTGP